MSRRPYRDAWESERVLKYIEERAGTEFEPEAANAFIGMMRKVEGGIQMSEMPSTNGAGAAQPAEQRPDSATAPGAVAPPKPPERAP